MNRNYATLFIIVMLLVFLFTSAHAQVFQGKILDKNESPISKAAIYLSYKNSIVNYAFSNAKGVFTVDGLNKKIDTLEVRRLGFVHVKIPLSLFKNGQNIVLYEQAHQLKEVVVKSEKIREEGDTLDYFVNAFRGKQDRTIADVLKKMPGLTVNDNGSIEYQGKAINKFYIEGMDLLGSKYAQASENINASSVKKVQVLKHHQPIKALKNMKFSEQAALNIVLTDSTKNVWSGMLDFALGGLIQKGNRDFLYDNKIVAMQFSRKYQSLSMYKNNNNGKNIADEIKPLHYFEQSVPTEESILNYISLSAPSLNKQRSLFNQSHLFATNWLFKTHKGNDLRLQLNSLWDRNNQSQQSVSVYTDAQDAIIEQKNTARSHHQELSGELKYEQNSDKLYLINRLSGYVDFDKSEGISILNGRERNEWVKPRQSYLTNRLSFLKNTKHNHSISAEGYVSFNYLPGKLLVSDSTVQCTRQHAFYAGGETYFAHFVGKIRLQYTFGSDYKWQRMDLVNSSSSRQKKEYQESRTYLQPEFSYHNGNFNVSADVPLYFTHRSYADNQRFDFTFEPNVLLHVKPLLGLDTYINYSYIWTPCVFAQMLDVPLFTDYITMVKGTGKLDHTMSHSFSANFEYQIAPKMLFFNFRYICSRMLRQQLYARKVVDDLYESYATGQTSNSTLQSIGGRISKGWSWMRLVVGLKGNYSCNSYNLLVSETVEPFLRQSCNMSVTFSVQPTDWFSLEESSSFLSTISKPKQSDVSKSSTLRSFQHQLKCYVMPGKWQIEWNNEIYHSNDKSVSFTYFSDISASYRTKRNEYGLSFSNIFGKDTFERRQITDCQYLYTLIRLRPREIMVRVMFNL